MSETPSPFKVPTAIRVLFGTFGLIFAGIGVTVIANLWFGEMGEGAPTFFKIVGSFISLAFIAMGGTFAFSALFGGGILAKEQQDLAATAKFTQEMEHPSVAAGPGNYVCPACGGKLTRADVSPLGDVKCEFCGSWFNIHGKR